MKKVTIVLFLTMIIILCGIFFCKECFAEEFQIVGTIEIPKINIKYSISSDVSVNALNQNICLLYGDGINEKGNNVLIGHNYRNGEFFSNLSKLQKDDVIYITDLNSNKVAYKVYDILTKSPTDTSYYQRDTEGKREITLSTSTDDAADRLVVFAKETSDITVDDKDENLQDKLSEAEKNAFNQKFKKYEGKQKGSVVKSLIQEVSENNEVSDSKKVKIEVKDSDIKTSLMYNIICIYDESGYVSEVKVEKSSDNLNEDNNKQSVVNTEESKNNQSSVTMNSGNERKNVNNNVLNKNTQSLKSSSSDTTSAKGVIPKTGISYLGFVMILVVLGVAILFGVVCNRYKGIY